jgi:hypothetical protein
MARKWTHAFIALGDTAAMIDLVEEPLDVVAFSIRAPR